jgi:hypothetical protein
MSRSSIFALTFDLAFGSDPDRAGGLGPLPVGFVIAC